MLHHFIQQYATSFIFTSRLMKHWKAALEQKYSVIPGITEMHDILISKKSGKVGFAHRKQCFDGEYTMHNYKYNCKQPLSTVSPYEPGQLSAEKVRQLSEQHRRYIKQDVPRYVVPVFLNQQSQNPVSAVVGVAHSLRDASQSKKRQCTYPGCNGSGHVDPGKKRHLIQKNCPLTATHQSQNLVAAAACSGIDVRQNKKRQCTYPGCNGSGHVDPGKKRHLTEKNCPLATKKQHN